MNSKLAIQATGTIAALLLSFIATELTKHVTESNLSFTSPMYNLHLLLLFGSVVLFVITGISYADSRHEHTGFNYLLYFTLGITHVVIVPMALLIAYLKIHLGQFFIFFI